MTYLCARLPETRGVTYIHRNQPEELASVGAFLSFVEMKCKRQSSLHGLMGVHSAIKHSSRQLVDLCPDAKCIFSLNIIISFLRIYPKEIIVESIFNRPHVHSSCVI